jgi:hypothetical protein
MVATNYFGSRNPLGSGQSYSRIAAFGNRQKYPSYEPAPARRPRYDVQGSTDVFRLVAS